MATSVTKSLIVETDSRKIELFRNDRGDVFIQEIDEGSDVPFWISISHEDWKEIKKFIDNQFENHG